MKKLLLVPMVFALIVFSLYHENVDGMNTSTKANVAQEIQMEEETFKIYNNSKDEMNTSIEVNKTTEEKFSVEIEGDLNTTKETVVSLKAVVKNAQKLEACNYFWYEDKVFIALGSTLEKAFAKGEHNITLIAKDANGTETNTSVILSAYNYVSTRKLHYDAHYGELLYVERMILNHKGDYVLYDNGRYSKELLTYNNEDQLIERVMEYYTNTEENKKILFTYDAKGNRLTSQTFNAEGISINYMLSIYDDNSSLIDMKFGTNADDINEYEPMVYEVLLYDETAYIEPKVPKDIIELNDNGKVIYEERYYGDEKIVEKMTYDDENKLIKSERSTSSSYDLSTTIIDYDEKANPVNREQKYEVKGQRSCHYSSATTYTDSSQIKTQVSVLLGGNCPYIDEIKRTYDYDTDGNVINVKSTTDNEDITEAHITLEVIKEYINELDI